MLVELNLEYITLLSIAVSIWERQDVKKKAKHYFYKISKKKNGNEWREIIKHVINLVDSKPLPQVSYCKLVYLIRDIGLKLYDFFNYIRNSKLFDSTPRKQLYDFYFKKIYWTPYGTIDEIRIFKESWMCTPEIKIHVLYNVACALCLEEYVEDLWARIPDKVKAQRYNKIYKSRSCHSCILAYWECCRNKKQINLTELLNRQNRNPDDLSSLEVNLFTISAKKGYKYAAKYFYNKMTDEEKSWRFFEGAIETVREFGTSKTSEYYKKDLFVDLLVFLFDHNVRVSDYNRESDISKVVTDFFEVFSDSDDDCETFLSMFIVSSPWQHLLNQIFEIVEDDLNDETYLKLLDKLISEINRASKWSLPINNCIYQQKFREIWLLSPAKFKKAVFNSVAESLYLAGDFSNMKMVINDPETFEETENLMIFFRKAFAYLVETNKYEEAVRLIQDLLPEKYPKNTRENIGILYELIFQGNFNLVDEKLDSMYSSDEERMSIKIKLDHKAITYYFLVKCDYDLADEFLLWRYNGSIEKVLSFKNQFQFDQFPCNHIYDIWTQPMENIEIAMNRSKNLLNWFLKSEEEIMLFKVNTFLNPMKEDKFIETFFTNKFVDRNYFEIIEHFLEWCLFSKEDICQVKQKVVMASHLKKCIAYLEANDFDMIDKYLKWACDSYISRVEFINKFWKKLKGERACKAYVRKICIMEDSTKNHEIVENLKKFISFWIRPLPVEQRKQVVKRLRKWAKEDKEPEDYETSSEEESCSSVDYDDDSGISSVWYDIFFPRHNYKTFRSLLNSLNDPYYDDWYDFD